MSEYQYYEFQALDRRLTEEEMTYVRSLSSRVQLTPTQAIFVYSYGDFRGNPEQVLDKCFDIMLYIANWGSKRLMFRFPKAAVDATAIGAYCTTDEMSFTETNDHYILDLNYAEGSHLGWIDGDGYLSGLIAVRDEILQGDFRALYLAWLKSLQIEREYDGEEDIYGAETEDVESDDDFEEDEFESLVGVSLDDHEPPVPPKLKNLSRAQQNLMDFLGVDEHLLAVAAETSVSGLESSEPVEQWIQDLSDDEKVKFLLQVINGEPNVGVLLMRRLRALFSSSKPPVITHENQRTVRSLLKAAQAVRSERKAKKQREAEQKKAQKMAMLEKQESEIWNKIWALIAQKQTKAYDEAIIQLKELDELARYGNRKREFDAKIRALQQKYPTLSGLRSRLQQAGLLR